MAYEEDDFEQEEDTGLSPEEEREAMLSLWRGDDKGGADDPEDRDAPEPQGDDRVDRLANLMENYFQQSAAQQQAAQQPRYQEPELPDFRDWEYQGEALNRFDEDQREPLRELLNEHGRMVAQAAYRQAHQTIGSVSQNTVQQAVMQAQQRMQAAQWLEREAPDVASAPEAIRTAVAASLGQNPNFQRTTDPGQRLQMFVHEARNLMGELAKRGGAASGGTRRSTKAPRGGARQPAAPQPKRGTQFAEMQEMLSDAKTRRRA